MAPAIHQDVKNIDPSPDESTKKQNKLNYRQSQTHTNAWAANESLAYCARLFDRKELSRAIVKKTNMRSFRTTIWPF